MIPRAGDRAHPQGTVFRITADGRPRKYGIVLGISANCLYIYYRPFTIYLYRSGGGRFLLEGIPRVEPGRRRPYRMKSNRIMPLGTRNTHTSLSRVHDSEIPSKFAYLPVRPGVSRASLPSSSIPAILAGFTTPTLRRHSNNSRINSRINSSSAVPPEGISRLTLRREEPTDGDVQVPCRNRKFIRSARLTRGSCSTPPVQPPSVYRGHADSVIDSISAPP